MKAELPRAVILRAIALAHPARPDPASGAELRDLLEEVDVGVEEERQARCEVIDAHPSFDARVDVCHSIGERERELLCGGRTRPAEVVARDGDRVALRPPFSTGLERFD